MILLMLILLHAGDGQFVQVNPDQITSTRSPREHHDTLFPPHTHCLVYLTDGKFVAVQEDCETVKRVIESK